MTNIKEIINIIDMTPAEQAILLEGIHGVGKSQCVETYITSEGYRMVVLFLGQMADAGDLTGLPDRELNKETGLVHTVFRPPFWWPKDDEEKFILFLEEMNRGKPELRQCIMDMVLNRKLMGRPLPKNCKLVGAMNPLSDDGYYQVDELDPALLDRFNRYDFKPTNDEWLDWALEKRLHRFVIGFIHKNLDMLDPQTDISKKANEVQPSRRSWERVSDLLIANKSIENNEDILRIFLIGMVGSTATSRFAGYVRETRKGLNAGMIIMNWTKDIERKLKDYELKDVTHLNKQVSFWFQDHEEELKSSKKLQATTMKSLTKYLYAVGNEGMAHFFNILATDNFNKKTYGKLILRLNPNVADKYFDTCNGKDEEEVPTLEEQ